MQNHCMLLVLPDSVTTQSLGWVKPTSVWAGLDRLLFDQLERLSLFRASALLACVLITRG